MEIIEGSRIRFQIKISTAALHGIFSGVFSFFQRIGDFSYLLGTKFCDRRQTQIVCLEFGLMIYDSSSGVLTFIAFRVAVILPP